MLPRRLAYQRSEWLSKHLRRQVLLCELEESIQRWPARPEELPSSPISKMGLYKSFHMNAAVSSALI